MKRLSPDEVAERLAQKSGIAKPPNGRAKRGRANLKPIMSWHDPAAGPRDCCNANLRRAQVSG